MTKRQKIPQPPSAAAHRARASSPEQSGQAYELFRQALVEKSPTAWEKLYAQYWTLVVKWVQQESALALSGEEAQHFANRAFEKMWRSITPTKFAKFMTLAALLKYLHLCVRSVVIDEARRTHHSCLQLHTLADTQLDPGADLAEECCDALQRTLFWSQIQARLKSPKEQLLIYCRFVLGLKPNRICEQYSETFANPHEVYTLLQTILARLRRDTALQVFALA